MNKQLVLSLTIILAATCSASGKSKERDLLKELDEHLQTFKYTTAIETTKNALRWVNNLKEEPKEKKKKSYFPSFTKADDKPIGFQLTKDVIREDLLIVLDAFESNTGYCIGKVFEGLFSIKAHLFDKVNLEGNLHKALSEFFSAQYELCEPNAGEFLTYRYAYNLDNFIKTFTDNVCDQMDKTEGDVWRYKCAKNIDLQSLVQIVLDKIKNDKGQQYLDMLSDNVRMKDRSDVEESLEGEIDVLSSHCNTWLYTKLIRYNFTRGELLSLFINLGKLAKKTESYNMEKARAHLAVCKHLKSSEFLKLLTDRVINK